MRRSGAVSAVVVGVLVVGAAGWFATRAQPSTPVVVAPVVSSPIARVRWQGWKTGVARAYSFELDTSQVASIAGQAGQPAQNGSGAIRLGGQLQLTVDQVAADSVAVRLQISRASNTSLSVAGRMLLDDSSVQRLYGTRAWLILAPNGQLREIRFRQDADQIATVILENIGRELQVTLEQGDNWESNETTSHGESTSAYRWSPQSPLLSRSRNYTKAFAAALEASDLRSTSAATIALDEHSVRSIDHEESLSGGKNGRQAFVVHTKFHLEALSAETSGTLEPVPEKNFLDREAIAKANALRDQMAGLTEAEFLSFVENFDNTRSDLGDLLARMNGYLQAHPEMAAKLKAIFMLPGTTHQERELVVDLLSQVGHTEAQKVLREILADAQVKKGPAYTQYAQRLSFVQQPDEATQSFVEEQHRTQAGNVHEAYGYVLGTIAGRLARAGDGPAALAYNQILVEELRRAPANRTANLVEAIGNAGLVENVHLVSGYAKSSDPEVRISAAIAMAHVRGDESLATLYALAKDPVARVRHHALTILAEYESDPEILRTVTRMVIAEEIPPTSYAPLLPMCQKAVHDHAPLVIALLDAMLVRAMPNDDVRTSALGLRQQLGRSSN